MWHAAPLLLEVEWGDLKLDEHLDPSFGPVHKWALLDDLFHTPMFVRRLCAEQLQVHVAEASF